MGHLNTGRWVSKPPVGSQIDWSHPLSRGLVGCWLMNEGAGKKINNLVIPSGGLFTGNTIVPTWESTKKGKALHFSIGDGLATEIDFDDKLLPSLYDPFTVEALVCPRASGGHTHKIIGSRGPAEWGFDLDIQNGNLIHADIGNGSGGWFNTAAQATFNYTAYQWIQVIFVVTRSTYYIYADGKFIGSGNTNATGPIICYGTSDHPLAIGAYKVDSNDYNYNFKGYISYVRFWRRALSPSEIQQLYQEPYCMIWSPTYYNAPAQGGLVWSTSEVVNVI